MDQNQQVFLKPWLKWGKIKINQLLIDNYDQSFWIEKEEMMHSMFRRNDGYRKRAKDKIKSNKEMLFRRENKPISYFWGRDGTDSENEEEKI